MSTWRSSRVSRAGTPPSDESGQKRACVRRGLSHNHASVSPITAPGASSSGRRRVARLPRQRTVRHGVHKRTRTCHGRPVAQGAGRIADSSGVTQPTPRVLQRLGADSSRNADQCGFALQTCSMPHSTSPRSKPNSLSSAFSVGLSFRGSARGRRGRFPGVPRGDWLANGWLTDDLETAYWADHNARFVQLIH